MRQILAAGLLDTAKAREIACKVHDLAGSDEMFNYLTQCMDTDGFVKVIISSMFSMPNASVEAIAEVLHTELTRHQLSHEKGGQGH